ncbi:MAG: sulfotransferase [Planctomycetales bacterium]|nr:sulfotransferase [Planctomycetales bacterium]
MKQNSAFTRWWHGSQVRTSRQTLSPRLWLRYLTADQRRLPDFLIAGAMKAGTTSLFGYLAGHPDCRPSLTKEVHYFDKNFERGEKWYRLHFPRGRTCTRSQPSLPLCFESSPYYMFDPRVPERLREQLPAAKVIFLLRNPIDRAFSHYQHSVLRGREPLTFEQAIEAEPDRLACEAERMLGDGAYLSPAHQHFSYLARGIYADQLARWRDHFPDQQLLVLESEQLFRSPHEAFAKTLAFLGLKPWEPAKFQNLYAGRYRDSIQPKTGRRLEEYFAPHNTRLFAMLGQRFDWQAND